MSNMRKIICIMATVIASLAIISNGYALVAHLFFVYGIGMFQPTDAVIVGQINRLGVAIVIAIGILLWCIHEFLMARRIRHCQSILARQDMVTIDSIAKENHTSSRKALKDVRMAMIRKLLPQCWIDVQESMVILNPEIHEEYEEQWTKWCAKQEQYKEAGVTTEEQEYFLEGKKVLHRFTRQDYKVKNSKIQSLVTKVIADCQSIFQNADSNPALIHNMKNLCSVYLPKLYQMAVNYQYMEGLSASAQSSEAAKIFEEFLEEFN